MASKREQVLAALFARLQTVPGASVRRNEALPQVVPAGGLIILRDGDPGEPDVTLNPVREYYLHRAEVEVILPDPVSGDAFAAFDDLLGAVEDAVDADASLGGLVENLRWGGVEIMPLAEEGTVPVFAARVPLTIEYLTSSALA